MGWLGNLSISKKILSLIAVGAIASLCLSLVGYYYTKSMHENNQLLYNDLVAVQLISEMLQLGIQNEGKVHEIIHSNPNRQKAAKDEIDANSKKINELQEKYKALGMDAVETEALESIGQKRVEYTKARNEIFQLALSGKMKEASEMFYTHKTIMDSITNIRTDLFRYNVEQADKRRAQIEASYLAARGAMIFISLLAIACSIIYGLVISRYITNPLKQVVKLIQAVAEGDLTRRLQSTVYKDEFGLLTKTVNSMSDNLHNLISRVSSVAEQITASSEELTANAEHTAQATGQITSSVAEAAQDASRQSGMVNDTRLVVEQASSGIQQVVRNANEVTSMAEKSASATKDGNRAVEKAIAQMASIEKTVNNSALIVANLGERSKEIGQIVETISGIAGQTNLLALNAAIEAARAGEQGRGFAVVAEEVRKLAEQCQEAAKQIADLIGGIQTDTDKAVQAMNEGTQEAKQGTAVVNNAGTALCEIELTVNQVFTLVQEVSAAMQQMASGGEQIVASVQEIETVSNDISQRTQTVSAAAEEQSASIEEIASASQSLAKIAQDLQSAVRKFRV